MKFLGRGWQYTVYDLGNKRVLKKYNTWLDSYLVMFKDSIRHKRLPVIGFSFYYFKGKKIAADSLSSITKSSIDKKFFGNPKVLNNFEYEQDFITPLSFFLKTASLDEGKAIVDKFIDFSKTLLNFGIIEKNFNFADNFGLNDLGEVVLMDLGEVCFDKNEIKNQIEKKVWRAPDVLSRFPKELHQYFLDKMDKTFNNAELGL